MPQTRPAEISDGVSLSDKLTGFVIALVPEDGAVDTDLAAVVFEPPPNPKGISIPRSQDDLFSGAAKEFRVAPIAVSPSAVMAVEKLFADLIAVFRDPPTRFIRRRQKGWEVSIGAD